MSAAPVPAVQRTPAMLFYFDTSAHLRIKLMSNDFSQWLYQDVGLTATAQALNRMMQGDVNRSRTKAGRGADDRT